MNYYNDNDPFAAKWINALIGENLIPQGYVDARSITDVKPEDLRGFRQCHFFAGIAGWSRALELAGWHPDEPVWTASLPCQPFSVAGKSKGKADERHLFPIFLKKVESEKPETIIGEQVSSKLGREWFDGKEKILQAMSDRETIVRVLQICNAFGDLPPKMQRMLQGRGAKEKRTDSKRGAVKKVQRVQGKKQGGNPGQHGKVSCETERLRVLFGESYRPPARCDRCGRLRTDGDSVQPDRGQDMGQPKPRQGGLFEGVYSGQCACGALLRKCDGEPMGGRQDNRDSGCDNGSQALSLRGISEQIRIRFETTYRYRSFSGVRPDLEALGYRVAAADLPAASVGSPHKRNRLFWVAQSGQQRLERHPVNGNRGNQPGRNEAQSGGSAAEAGQSGWLADSDRFDGNGAGSIASNDSRKRQQAENLQGFWSNSAFIPCADGKYRRVPVRVADNPSNGRNKEGQGITEEGNYGVVGSGRWEIEPALFPLANGIPQRVGLLRGAGNAIVPPVAAEFVKAFMDIQKSP